MNIYPQIRKVIHTLWESPIVMRNNRHPLTRSVRSTRSTRTAAAVDSQASKDRFKLYLHSRVVTDSQYQCAYKLYMKESKFDSRAVNGSHYGIPQLRNNKIKHLDGFTQIDWGIRYIAHRYKGDYCLAWAHFKSKGWH